MRSIMIVDDEKSLLHLYGMLLNEEGYSTLLAASEKEAFQLLDKNPIPRLFLVDACLPGTDGGKFVKKIRERIPQTEPVRFIGFSNAQPGSPLTEALESQVDVFWEKPNDIREFVTAVNAEWERFAADVA